ncbi:efflux RND transporter periplasmic adaptor subunit [Ramlibacter sp. WS9]|uniref:efflux RND transporter periplasmic adaptor subunit n=1 Tax=Ramlibacter sp. WS9 TaxID=1882741 RepID=UPI0011431898|nr:efflux RND transporter periplasmic adaptor subunit [Ramlibacter sp. WS9]
MDAQPPGVPEPTEPHPNAVPERRRLSRRATLIGSVIAIAVVAGIGWLAWDLTHPDKTAVAEGGRAGAGGAGGGAGPGGPGGPGGAGGGRGGRGPATTVGIAVAERADIPIVIDALGTVVPQATVRVRPQVSGVLQQLAFKEGQMVKKGDLLALIDPRQFEMSLQQASGQRLRDEAQLEAAKVTLQRFRTLLQQDSIARQEVDTQAALVKQLEAAVVMSKANEGTARLNLGYTRIVSPLAGRVGLRAVDVGNVVSASDANGVALITAISPIDVEFAVPQDQAPALQQNAGAFMEAKAFDRTRQTVLDTGVFTSLDNQVDTQTGTVRAKARFNNTRQALFPSQFVNIQLSVRVIKDAVVVPVAAVRNGSTGEYVFVLKDDKTVALRPVTRGQATVDKVQIATGLQIGERVITEGADRLRDGSRVVLPGDAPGGGARGTGEGRRRRGAEGAAPGASAPAGDASSPASPALMGAVGGASGAGGERRRRSDAAPAAAGAAAAAPATAVAATAAPPAGAGAKPTPEQRERMLDSAKGDPEQLERRKRFLEAIDRGDPQALERWQTMQQRRREGGGSSQ